MLELSTSSSKENARTWVNMGEVASGDIVEVPFASRDDDIEFRIKFTEVYDAFPHWSSTVRVSPKSDAIQHPLHLVDKNGATVFVWAGIDINRSDQHDFLEQMKLYNSASRVIFFYTQAILIDNTGQNLEFLNGRTVLQKQNSAVISRFGGLSIIKEPTAAVYMIGGKSRQLAFRQSEVSRWSSAISIKSNRKHTRILVPRPSYPSSRPLILCAKTTDAPTVFGGKNTKGELKYNCSKVSQILEITDVIPNSNSCRIVTVVSIENKYVLLNLLPIAIEVISTNKSGSWQEQRPLVVSNTPIPLHFDDSGFIRLR